MCLLILKLQGCYHDIQLYLTILSGILLLFNNSYTYYSSFTFDSEMCHGNRWHSEFLAPMVMHNSERIFVNDFVQIIHSHNTVIAKILKFFQKVQCAAACMHVHNHALCFRKMMSQFMPRQT